MATKDITTTSTVFRVHAATTVVAIQILVLPRRTHHATASA